MSKNSKNTNRSLLRGMPTPPLPIVGKARDQVTPAPVAYATKRVGRKPKVMMSNGNTTVSHRSFLMPISNSSVFAVVGVSCNPGLASSFPWVSKLARRYEEYRITKLRYEFRSVTASSKPGVVMMSFDYDAADEAPSTKAEQSQTIPNSETNVWMNNDLVVRTDNSWRFIRAGGLAANLDVKTYDAGTMWLSTAYGDGVVGGELYVEYTVEFRRPTDGPETCGILAAVPSSFITPFNSGIRYNGVAFPFTVLTNSTLKVVAGGEFLAYFCTFGTALNADITVPTIASSSTTSTITSLNANYSTTKATMLMRIQCEAGDVITFSFISGGSGLIDCKFWVAAADYRSVYLS